MTVATLEPDPANGSVDGDSPTTTDVYDQYGDLVSETSPSATGSGNDTTTYSYNALGEPEQQTVGDNTLGPVFDAAGNVVSDTDLQNGAVTYYTYNARNELVQTTAPATDGDSADTLVTQYAYDPAGNQLTQTTYANYAFNADGTPREDVTPQPMVTTFTYDALNRETSVSLPNPSDGSAGGPTTSYGYDLVGNLISTTSPSPTGSGYVTTTNTYDQANNLESSTDANGDVTTYSHDGVGDTLSLTDSDGNTTSWGVNHLGQTTSQSQVVALGYFPDGTVETTVATSYDFYGPAGNLTTSIDSDHRSISYAYDHLFQETGQTWTDASGSAAGGVAYSYNPAGYMTAASNGTGSSTSNVASYGYQYTTTGNVQLENVDLPGADDTNVALQSTYDYNNNRTTFAATIGVTPTLDDGFLSGFTGGTNDFENTYSYNTLGSMTGITQTGNGGNTVTDKNVVMTYDADERVSGIDMYQSSGTSSLVAAAGLGYNGDSELTDLTYNTLADGTGTVLAGYHWDYNASGAVSDMYSHNDSSAGTPNTSYVSGSSNWGKATYSYDPTAQLLGASYSNFTNAPTTDSGETYDPNGNRTNVTPPSPAATTTGADNRLLFDGTYYYNYDAEGNRTAKFISTSGVLDDTATDITIYTWNNVNQLVGAAHYNTYAHYESPTVTAVGEYSITYGNDAFGRMVTRTAVLGTGSSTTTSTENFIYDGQNIVLILDGDGNVVERELTGAAPDQVFASENASTNAVNWYLTDNQGTVRDVVRLVSGTPTVENHLIYAAFGNLTGQTSTAAGDQPTFSTDGAYLDPQTFMNKMGARWADLVDAVFLPATIQAAFLPASNPFAYCGNSPTNFTDPSGMAWLSVSAVAQRLGGQPTDRCRCPELCFHRPRSAYSAPARIREATRYR